MLGKSLYGSKTWVDKLDLTYELNGHMGCVNTLSYDTAVDWLFCLLRVDGVKKVNISCLEAMIIDCSFGLRMANLQWGKSLTLVYPSFVTMEPTLGHRGNIFSAKFMPHTNNRKIISCAGDDLIKLSEVEYTRSRQAIESTKRTWHCHTDMAKRLVTEDNPNTFLSCSEDGISGINGFFWWQGISAIMTFEVIMIARLLQDLVPPPWSRIDRIPSNSLPWQWQKPTQCTLSSVALILMHSSTIVAW